MAVLATLAAELEALLAELLAALEIDIDALDDLLESEERAEVLFALLAEDKADDSEEERELCAEVTPLERELVLPTSATEAELIALDADAEFCVTLAPVGAGLALLVRLESGGY